MVWISSLLNIHLYDSLKVTTNTLRPRFEFYMMDFFSFLRVLGGEIRCESHWHVSFFLFSSDAHSSNHKQYIQMMVWSVIHGRPIFVHFYRLIFTCAYSFRYDQSIYSSLVHGPTRTDPFLPSLFHQTNLLASLSPLHTSSTNASMGGSSRTSSHDQIHPSVERRTKVRSSSEAILLSIVFCFTRVLQEWTDFHVGIWCWQQYIFL